MSIKLEARTNNRQLLKLVGIEDDAIDWDATYPDEGSLDAKRARYLRTHDIRELQWKEGCDPTVFVFEHPARVDVDRKVRHYWTQLLKPGAKNDLWIDVWNGLYLGLEEGLVNAPRQEPPRQGTELTQGFLQALLDEALLQELGQAVLDAAQQKAERRVASADAKKK